MILEKLFNKLCVPYNLAKDLMDIGFNEPCFDYFLNGIEQNSLIINYNNETNFETVARLTFDQAFIYFLDEHKLDSCINIDNSYEIYGGIHTLGYKNPYHIESKIYESKDICKIECLKKLIEIVK